MNPKKLLVVCVIVIICVLVGAVAVTSNQQKETQINVISSPSLYTGENVSVKLTTLNGTPIANQTVNITLVSTNGTKNTYNLVTNSEGIATFQLSGVTPGTYTLEYAFGGGNGYKQSNNTTALEVKEKEKVQETSSSSKDSSSSTCPHGNPSVNECPTCYDIRLASEWVYIDTDEYPSAAWHNEVREEAIKERKRLGI